MTLVCDAFLRGVLGDGAAAILESALAVFKPSPRQRRYTRVAKADLMQATALALPDLMNALAACDKSMGASFATPLLCPSSAYAAQDDEGCVDLSPHIETLPDCVLRAVAAPHATTTLDAGSERWIALLLALAAQGRTAHFLYRSSSDASAIDRQQNLKILARRMAQVAGSTGPTILVAMPSEARGCGSVGLDLLRSALLPSDLARSLSVRQSKVIKLIARPHLFSGDEGSEWGDDDDLVLGAAVGGAGIGLIKRHHKDMRGVHVWCCQQEAVMPLAAAGIFGGAFGPASPDPTEVRRVMAHGAPDSLSEETLDKVVTITGGAAAAGGIFSIVKALSTDAPLGDDEVPNGNALARMLAASLAAHLPRIDVPRASHGFSLDLLNTDVNIEALFQRASVLRDHGTRFLFHGEPGTGKSLAALELAKRMGVRFREHRGGDVFASQWGATERKIASIFQAAEIDDAALSFEECDSLFVDRAAYTGNNKMLAVTATNEFLAALDRFENPVFASTNAIEAIDPAIRRRFHIVVQFRTLSPAQERKAWRTILGLRPPRGTALVGNTVPADYTTAAKRLKIFGEEGATAARRHLQAARDARRLETGPTPARVERSQTCAEGSLCGRAGFVVFEDKEPTHDEG